MGNALVAAASITKPHAAEGCGHVRRDARSALVKRQRPRVDGAVIRHRREGASRSGRAAVLFFWATGGFRTGRQAARGVHERSAGSRHSNALFRGRRAGDGFSRAAPRNRRGPVDDKHHQPGVLVSELAAQGHGPYPHILLDTCAQTHRPDRPSQRDGTALRQPRSDRLSRLSSKAHVPARKLRRSPAFRAWLVCLPVRFICATTALGCCNPSCGAARDRAFKQSRMDTCIAAEVAQWRSPQNNIGVDAKGLGFRGVAEHKTRCARDRRRRSRFGKGRHRIQSVFNGDPANKPNPVLLRPIVEGTVLSRSRVPIHPRWGTCVGLSNRWRRTPLPGW